jgi:hypothetical protein
MEEGSERKPVHGYAGEKSKFGCRVQEESSHSLDQKQK